MSKDFAWIPRGVLVPTSRHLVANANLNRLSRSNGLNPLNRGLRNPLHHVNPLNPFVCSRLKLMP